MAERPEDLNLPNSIITRIIKDAIPDGVNVSKDARLAISKAASVFVLYATSCANNFAQQNKRKMISGQDVLDSMTELEFDELVEPLKKSLEAYKKSQKDKKEATEKRKQEKTQEKGEEKTEENEEEEMEEEAAGGGGVEEEEESEGEAEDA
ncbi:hypothetical protein CAPTEDRAFT_184024 [Capitella teleta]|uniref:DNA polymerase epsilon subunit 3 n=1 Tax=Capitella teleta TaxID=283909 RepID=R7TVV9_CAPTE|nr:hypothetical protein CAPTEDRAFT_184024 [Capitella teleta]|eukprot:ELT97819.1 hypothetical protein CAPTEDRAFT_184024 [Capitella teleta]